MPDAARAEEPVLRFAGRPDFEAWLEQNHEGGGVWLAIGKGGTTSSTVSYAEAVDVALCFGWIDGQKRRGDEEHWLQRFTPRSGRSRWSRINRDKAEGLIASGRMRASGLEEVERAEADGRWDAAYEGQRTAALPDDLRQELDRDPAVAAAFADLDSRNRFSIIWRLDDAKRPETRARRLKKFVEMLHRGETLHG